MAYKSVVKGAGASSAGIVCNGDGTDGEAEGPAAVRTLSRPEIWAAIHKYNNVSVY